MKKLDLLTLDFTQNYLIESSAGTGKTFSIIILYLRLMLNINIKNYYMKNLSAKKILILTFTNYTKKDIYIKIKLVISQLKKDCIKKTSNNDIYKKIIKNTTCPNSLYKKLSKLEKKIDKFNIMTIHQFCNTIIEENKLYFNIPFNKKIVKDENKMLLCAIQKFWRKNFYPLQIEVVSIIYNIWKTPENIFKEIKHLFKNNIQVKFNKKFEKSTILSFHFSLIKEIIIFKKIWKSNKNIFKRIIIHLKKEKKGYIRILNYSNKVDIWSKKKTKNYYIPNEIEKIIKLKSIKKYVNTEKKTLFFFKYIKLFYKKKFSIKEFLIYKIYNKIHNLINIDKKKTSKISFDDLVKEVEKKLRKNKKFLVLIKKKYPVAIIDEFQDTDICQQKIFTKIYNTNKNRNIMILLADPKQCIYSFRGSNILLYNRIKKKIKKHYFLDINWRSSPNLVKSINKIFSQIKYPFATKKIIFKKIKYTKKNNNIRLTIKNSIKKNFKIIFYKKSVMNFEEYFLWSSKQCAKQISNMLYLGNTKQAQIKYHKKNNFVKKEDIVILVKNKLEFFYIKKALKKYKIESYYQSEKTNIYKTEETREILLLLQAISEITNKQNLINANSTRIISSSINEIYMIQNNKNKFFHEIKKFKKYKQILEKYGILNLIKYVIKNNIIEKKCFKKEKYEKLIKRYFYISKCLEKKLYEIKEIYLLIQWLEEKINQKKFVKKKYFNKNEKYEGIKVTTIHKSKGLEYPIVIIPFIMHFKKENYTSYYDTNTLTRILNLKNKKTNDIIKENFLESIRLLYVSLTRAIVHCTIIIAAIKKNNKFEKTTVHKSGIGYILQKKKCINFINFKKILNKLKKTKLFQITNNIKKIQEYKCITEKTYKNYKKKFKEKKYKKHNINSFTKIIEDIEKIKKKYKINNVFSKKTTLKSKSKILNTYNFPQGKNSGRMLHKILKEFIKKKRKKTIFIKQELKRYNFNIKYYKFIYSWMNNIIRSKINKIGIRLSKIKRNEFIQDMKFDIFIKEKMHKKIQDIFSSKEKHKIKIYPGILTGVIDIVFLWKNKYYFIDFKFNHLGNKIKNYTKENIKNYIIKMNYDIQYKIYLLGIHKYLKTNIQNYSSKKHFGGIFYLFLRAFKNKNNSKKYGKFFISPKENIIKHIENIII
ncbi:exodeoxyribonuclease V subunit beta [Buchnera aphidicola (Chaitoregma tattakana)]|uniref:exodeoxyribonuclease V subunit beta n=1 Tax=Buchnera aphidicola TaxID=9 RepID=UPI0031B8A574